MTRSLYLLRFLQIDLNRQVKTAWSLGEVVISQPASHKTFYRLPLLSREVPLFYWQNRCPTLLIEATDDRFQLPDKGIVGEHAVFDAAMLDIPRLDEAFRAQQTESEWRVVVKRRDALTTITYPFNPLDALGWHGTLAPVRLNWRDLRPLMSHRYHLPPSAHTTFTSASFVISTFCPRPLEIDPGALRLPFFHHNDDYDEMIFFHRGRSIFGAIDQVVQPYKKGEQRERRDFQPVEGWAITQ